MIDFIEHIQRYQNDGLLGASIVRAYDNKPSWFYRMRGTTKFVDYLTLYFKNYPYRIQFTIGEGHNDKYEAGQQIVMKQYAADLGGQDFKRGSEVNGAP